VPWRHIWGTELPTISTLTLNIGKWSATHKAHLSPKETTVQWHWTVDCDEHGGRLDITAKLKPLPHLVKILSTFSSEIIIIR